MTTTHAAPFTLDQIGTGIARFPSGVPIPTHSDAMVDPYIKTRMPKEVQVETILFWPQEKALYPSLVLLHDRWGLTGQIKDLGARLACEGYVVVIPNLYGRIGGMVTANDEVGEALMAKIDESLVLRDINSCCEYLNTKDFAKRNIHGVVGYGMGASLALRFAAQRKRLRATVAYYGKMFQPRELMKEVISPILYHQAGRDIWATADDAEQLRAAAAEYGKKVEFCTYPDAPHAFCNEMKADSYRADLTATAWERSAVFLKTCFQGT
jgi:carboxymethylenebutenolidase